MLTDRRGARAGLRRRARLRPVHDSAGRWSAISSILGDVIGSNSTASLSFHDHAAAEDALRALRRSTHVVAAAIYDKTGAPVRRVFARSRVNREPCPEPRVRRGRRDQGSGWMGVFRDDPARRRDGRLGATSAWTWASCANARQSYLVAARAGVRSLASLFALMLGVEPPALHLAPGAAAGARDPPRRRAARLLAARAARGPRRDRRAHRRLQRDAREDPAQRRAAPAAPAGTRGGGRGAHARVARHEPGAACGQGHRRGARTAPRATSSPP